MSDSCQNYPLAHDNDNYPALNSQSAMPTQAETDEQLISLWLHGRSNHTQRAYGSDIDKFLGYVNKPLHHIILRDLQDFTDKLFQDKLSETSVKRIISSVKSLFAFAHRLGYIQYDIGKALKLPSCRETIAERILTEEEVHTIINSVKNMRNRLIIKTLYYTGIRVSELVSLKWKHLQHRDLGGQISILGKGGKSNVLLIPQELWIELMGLKRSISDDDPVFKSRKGGHLNPSHVERILKKIAIEAIGKGATPHWYRHSHASHALENGCPIHLVQKQLNHSSIATTGRYLHARPTESSSEYLK